MSLNYCNSSLEKAKELRQSMTRHERHLWYDFLRKYQPRFQRQKTIGIYIVDFYCHKAKLVIELDGSQHFDDEYIVYDAKRTVFLEKNQLKVMRFTNLEIDKYFQEVCQAIDMCVKERL